MRSSLLLLAAASSPSFAWVYPASSQMSGSASITINTATKYQEMIGGGCSGAFGIACQQFGSMGLSAANQELVTETLFSENIGGLSVVRNGIGSSASDANGGMASILPVCPATPAGPFNYVWDHSNTCQFNLTVAAKKYNPDIFVYADAWSAPGCMKTIGTDNDGGFICGVRGSQGGGNCTHDWRQAYADYLVQYVRFYKESGIEVNLLGAWNEPDFNPVTYASMESDGYQAKDFLEVLYPTVKKAFPDLEVSCCDATGARQERNILYELDQAGGTGLFDIATWHNYQSNPERPFNSAGKRNLMTEWADGTGAWNPNWDVSGQLAEGFQWALYMHNAFVNSDTSGYTHWWCAQDTTGDNALIRLNGNSFYVAARLWAFAGYFRFARPGAVRVDATSNKEDLYVSAYVNQNGSLAVPFVNAAHFPYTVDLELKGKGWKKATAYLTDNSHNVSNVGESAVHGSTFQATVEPRAMKTFFFE